LFSLSFISPSAYFLFVFSAYAFLSFPNAHRHAHGFDHCRHGVHVLGAHRAQLQVFTPFVGVKWIIGWFAISAKMVQKEDKKANTV
jgi:hypothetical protein